MAKTTKRIIGIVLAVLLIVAAVPFAVLAAEGEEQSTTTDAAKIGETSYSSLQEAVDAADAGETVTLLSNITVNAEDDKPETQIWVKEGKDVIIDLNGNTVTGAFFINGKATIKNGTVRNNSMVSGIETKGTLVLENMTVTSDRHAVRVSGGTATIISGTYQTVGTSGTRHTVNASGADTVLDIQGGTFYGAGHADLGASGNCVMDNGCKAVTISGGSFIGSNGVEGCICADDGLAISGGSFCTWSYDSYLADGYWAFQKYNTKNTFFVEQKKEAPEAAVTEQGAITVEATDYTANNETVTLTLESAYTFTAPHDGEGALNSQYSTWHADFVVSIDQDIPKGSIILAGNYGDYGWISFTNQEAFTAGTRIRLLKDLAGLSMNYYELCTLVKEFKCGVADIDNALNGVMFTVELQLFRTAPYAGTNTTWNEEKGETVTVNTQPYLLGSGETSVENGVVNGNVIPGDKLGELTEVTVNADGVTAVFPVNEGIKNSVFNVEELPAPEGAIAAYDLTLTKSGAAVEINGDAEVTLPIPAGYNAGDYSFKVFYVNGEVREEMTVTDITNESVTFATSHFSEYIITAEEKPDDPTVWDGVSYDTSWYAADPSAKEYTLTTAAQVAGLIDLVSGKYSGGANYSNTILFSNVTIKLGADIDLAGYEWTPIGTRTLDYVTTFNTDTKSFQGIFDGQGHTISNLKITDNNALLYNVAGTTSLGFFSGISGNAKVMNVTFVDPVIEVTGAKNLKVKKIQIGVAVGSGVAATTSIDNVRVTGLTWNAEAQSGGGIVGIGYNVTNCSVEGTVVTKNDVYGRYFGGIAGTVRQINNTVTDFTGNTFSGTISGETKYPANLIGLATFADSGTSYRAIRVANCSVIGDTGVEDDFAIKEGAAQINRDGEIVFGNFDLVVADANEGESVVLLADAVVTEEQVAALAEKNLAIDTNGYTVTYPSTNWIDSADTAWYVSHETDSEFTITTAEQLAGLAKLVNEGTSFNNKTVKLGADIDLAGLDWTPIGTNASQFKGSFDGQNNVISNLTINSAEGWQGLFGYVQGELKTTIQNLTINNVSITSGGQYVGALAASATNVKLIYNCNVTGTINIVCDGRAGVLIGNSYVSVIDSCRIDGTDSAVSYLKGKEGAAEGTMGGIVGQSNESYGIRDIKNCSVMNITIEAKERIGSIVGSLHNGSTVVNCHAENVVLTAAETNSLGDSGLIVGRTIGSELNEQGNGSGVTYVINNTYTNVICTAGGESVTKLHGLRAEANGAFAIAGTDVVLDGNKMVTAGTFERLPAAYVAEGYMIKDNGNGTYSVKVCAAEVGGVKFETLAEAIEAAGESDVITLLGDFEISEMITVPAGKDITIEGNGFTVSRADGCIAAASVVKNPFDCTTLFYIQGKLTIKNLTIDAKGSAGASVIVVTVMKGQLDMYDSVIKGGYADAGSALFIDGTVNMYGGSIEGNGTSAASTGGIIWVYDMDQNGDDGLNAYFNMYSGKITGNNGGKTHQILRYHTNGYGYLNGEISGNTAQGYGGVLYHAESGMSKITFGPDLVIKDNTMTVSGTTLPTGIYGGGFHNSSHRIDSEGKPDETGLQTIPLPGSAPLASAALKEEIIFCVTNNVEFITRRTLLSGTDTYQLTEADLAKVKVYYVKTGTNEYEDLAENSRYELRIIDNRIELIGLVTVTFSAEGAEPATQTVKVGAGLPLDIAELVEAPTKSGYAFKNWYLENGGYAFGADGTFHYTSNVTLIAKWEEIPAVAEVNGTKYESFDEALSVWTTNGGELKLLDDVTTSAKNSIGTTASTLDLNGHVWTFSGAKTTSYLFVLAANADLTVTDTVGGGEILNNQGRIFDADATGAKLTLTNIVLTDKNSTAYMYAYNLTMNGCKIYIEKPSTSGSIQIKGDSSIVDSEITVGADSKGILAKVSGGVVTISGNTVMNANAGGKIVEVRGGVIINGGTFTGEIKITGTDSYVTVNGGDLNGANIKLYTKTSKFSIKTDLENKPTIELSGLDNYILNVSENEGLNVYVPQLDPAKIAAKIGNVSYATLQDAITAAQAGEEIDICNDVNLGSGQGWLQHEKSITIDLNGHTVSGTNRYIFYITKGEMTVIDSVGGGKIHNTAESTAVEYGVYVSGGAFTLQSGTIDAETGIYLSDADCTANIAGGEVSADSWGIISWGGTVNVTGGTINGQYGVDIRKSTGKVTVSGDAVINGTSYGINGNGTVSDTVNYGGTTIEITGGTVTGGAAAIYHPQAGTMTISGGEITGGMVAIQMCSGKLDISGSPVITSNGTKDLASTGGDGLIIDGAAISIVDRGYPGGAPEVTISGTPTITAQEGEDAISAYTWNSTDKAQDEWADAGENVAVSGGTFSSAVPEELCSDTFIPTQNEDGTYSVKEGSFVARVDGVGYEVFAEAIAALNANGGTLTLLADVIIPDRTSIEKITTDCTIDFNGYTISGVGKSTGPSSALLYISGATVELTDTSDFETKGGIITTYTGSKQYYTISVNKTADKDGKLIVTNGVRIENYCNHSTLGAIYLYVTESGMSTAIEIDDAFITTNKAKFIYIQNYSTAECKYTISINRGTFVSTAATSVSSSGIDANLSYSEGKLNISGGSFSNLTPLAAKCTTGGLVYSSTGVVAMSETPTDYVAKYNNPDYSKVYWADAEIGNMLTIISANPSEISIVKNATLNNETEYGISAGTPKDLTIKVADGATLTGTLKTTVANITISGDAIGLNIVPIEGYEIRAGSPEGTVWSRIASDKVLVQVIDAEGNVKELSSVSNIKNYITEGCTIKVMNEVSTSDTLIKSYSFTLDLNGHTWTYTGTRYAIRVQASNKTYTITDTSVNGGGQLVVTNANALAVTTSANYSGNTINFEGKATVVGLNLIEGKNNIVNVKGNATLTNPGSIALQTNGSSSVNTVINILDNATVKAEDGIAIYFPGSGELNVSGGLVEGATAIVIRAGELNISGGKLVGNGEAYEYEFVNSGCMSTGDAVIIENCAYPGGAPTATITGGVFESLNGVQIGAYFGNGVTEIAEITSTNESLTAPEGYEWSEEGKLVEKAKLFEIYGANMTLGNSLDFNFAVKFENLNLEKIGSYYALITRTFADGTEDTLVIPSDEWTEYSGLYSIKYQNVAAKEMTDSFSVQIFMTDENEEDIAVSAIWEDSIKGYAMRMLEKADTSADVRTLLVDMLNYGAASQTYFGYATDDLANAELTAEMQSWATQSGYTVQDSRVRGENYYGTNLTLENNIEINFAFNNIEDITGMYAKIEFTDHNGKAFSYEVTEFTRYYNGKEYYYAVKVDTIVLSDVSEMITCTVYDASGNVHSTVTDSMESYIARNLANESTNALLDCVMKFCVSSKTYVNNENNK